LFYVENFSLKIFIYNLPKIFWKSFCNLILKFNAYHLWYLCVLIGLYVITPILRIFIKHSNQKTVKFVLLMLFITTSLIPTLNNYFNLNIMNFTEVSSFVFMYLIGYFIVNTKYIKSTYIYWGGLIGFIVYIIACCFNVGDQLDVFMIMEAMMIIKFLSTNKIKIKTNKIINCVSKYSLGIYIVHPFWLIILNSLKIYFTIFPLIIGEIVFFAYALIMSLLTSMILYRLPLIKKLFK